MAITKVTRTLLSTGIDDQSNATAITIDSSENVGIGTASPSTKLDVYGSDPRIQSSNSTATVKNILLAGGTAGYTGMTTNHPLVFITNDTEAMRIDSSGNVGIGTTSPNAALDVLGTTSDQLRLRTAESEEYKIGRNASTGFLDFSGTQSGFTGYTFGGVDGERMRIDSSGNVGIGTTSPSRLLDIENTSGDVYISLVSSNTIGTSGLLLGDADADYAGRVEYYNSSNAMALWTSNAERMRIDSSGRITAPYQPAFQAEPTSTQTDIAINEFVEVALGTERIDVGANFASNTFTAPVTGKYQLNANIRLNNVDSAAGYYQMRISTSNRDYFSIFDPDFGQDAAYWSFGLAVLADMDASDTAKVEIIQLGGTSQTDIHGDTKFSGYLVA